MNNASSEPQVRESNARAIPEPKESAEKAPWEKPRMEDVSEQVMAQPYIRFT